MPLLDHFHPPLGNERRWESFFSSWATRISDTLTEGWLPEYYIAEEYVHRGPFVDIDLGSTENLHPQLLEQNGSAIGTAEPKVWTPPVADAVIPAVFPDTFEVKILSMETGPKLVAAIELISPSNKDRPAERKAFATKVASYIYQGISVILVDIVTTRRANLHNEVLKLLDADEQLQSPPEQSLYATALRPVIRGKRDEIDRWNIPLALGGQLPTLPLRLREDLVIPVEFESTYADVCRWKRLTDK
jgi:hypothetical protein